MRMKKTTVLILFVGLGSWVSSFGQSRTKQYSSKELKEDYVKFYTITEKVHTGLYDYISTEKWNSMKDSAMRLLNQPMNERDFFQLIAYQVSAIRNIHTRHGVTDKWIRKKSDIFPFHLSYFGDRLYVRESLRKDLQLPKGTEILEINGNTPLQIKRAVWPYMPADGYIETQKQAVLNGSFSWFYALFVEEPKTFRIKYKTDDGNVHEVTTRGLKESFRKLGFAMRAHEHVSALDLQIYPALRTAYFRIEDSRLFKDSLHIYFERLLEAKLENLVIDLRGDGGMRDDEQTVQLFSYLTNRPFLFAEQVEVKSNDYSLFDKDFTYRPYANTLQEIREQYFDKLIDSGNGYFLWKNEPALGIQQPADLYFKGKIYILVDGRNHSASTDFTSKASTLDNVFIVGEETGGNYRSYVSGAMFGLVLPNTKIGVKIATWKSILNIEENPLQTGRGVLPDFPVTQTLNDFLIGRDTVKEFVFDLIRNGG